MGLTRSRFAMATVAMVVVVAGGVLALRARGDAGVERVRSAVAWPHGCAAVATHDATGQQPWPGAERAASITCEHLGPGVFYARFADIADLKQDLLRKPPSAPICIVAREVIVDYLDPPQFSGLCRRLGGDRVDAVSTLAALPWDGTVGGMDRQVAAEVQRAAAAQGRALRGYWHVS